MNRRHSSSAFVLSAAVLGLSACAAPTGPEPVARAVQASSTLQPVASFGSNPGNLLMYAYAPASAPTHAPLVLALHGCTETAAAYTNAGWNDLADKYGFYVLYPQQQSSNNTETCFNWFGNTSGSTADITRGQGEAESIIQMIQTMESTYSIDSKRVFMTGFSAGAAYAVAMLAMYPDVFAAGASFSGVPAGCANSLATAYTCMSAPPSKSSADWGALARAAYPGYTGAYPRLTVWQGSGDTTVSTMNLAAIVAQWTNLTGASTTPTSGTVGGYPHDTYSSPTGVQVESYSITSMAHAVAIDPSAGCGTADTYDVAESICAADYAAKFFGIEGAQSGSSSGGGSGSGSSSGATGSSSGGSSSGTGSSSGASSSGAMPGDDAGTGGMGNGSTPAGAGAAATPPMPGCSIGFAPRPGSTGLLAGLFVAIGVAARRARRRRARASRASFLAKSALGAMFALGLSAFSNTARAAESTSPDDEPVAHDPPQKDESPTEAPKKRAYMGHQGTFFTGASVSSLPAVLFGYFPVDELATTIGLGFTYNGNGSPTSPLTEIKGAPNNRVGSDLFLDAMYFVHDEGPFAMGPELNFISSLSPNYVGTAVVLTPMWALRYAPWKVPIAIGTGLGVSFTFLRGAQPMVALATQGLDLVYAF